MHSGDQINPAEQVERIREILVGRDIEVLNKRIEDLEAQVTKQSNNNTRELAEKIRKTEENVTASQKNIQSITGHIREQLLREASTRSEQIRDLAKKIDDSTQRMEQSSKEFLSFESSHNQDISKQIESLSSEMAARIDAHSRQIMEHMHREIQQWKNRMDGQLSALSEEKLDRDELTTRLARIASAAMGDAVPPSRPPAKSESTPGMGGTIGSSLGSSTAPTSEDKPNLSSLDVFAMPTDDYTT